MEYRCQDRHRGIPQNHLVVVPGARIQSVCLGILIKLGQILVKIYSHKFLAIWLPKSAPAHGRKLILLKRRSPPVLTYVPLV